MSANIPEIIEQLKTNRRNELKAKALKERRTKIKIRLRSKRLVTEMEEHLRLDHWTLLRSIVAEENEIHRLTQVRFR